MSKTISLEEQAKTPFTIQNRPGQTLLSAHEYAIQKYMEKHFGGNSTNPKGKNSPK